MRVVINHYLQNVIERVQKVSLNMSQDMVENLLVLKCKLDSKLNNLRVKLFIKYIVIL